MPSDERHRFVHQRASYAAHAALRRAHPAEFERAFRAAVPTAEAEWADRQEGRVGRPPAPRCACGNRLNKAARDAGRDKCGTCTRHAELQGSRPARPPSVREWAWENGHPAAARGRLPAATVRAWREANPDAPRLREEDRLDGEHRAGSRGYSETLQADEPEPEPARRGRDDDADPRPCPGCGNPLPRLSETGVCSSCTADREGRELAAGDDRHRVRLPRLESGQVRSSDGTVLDLRPATAPSRDERGRVVCRGCGLAIEPEWLSCGCDPGFVDDDGLPCDPRFRPGGEHAGMFLPIDTEEEDGRERVARGGDEGVRRAVGGTQGGAGA